MGTRVVVSRVIRSRVLYGSRDHSLNSHNRVGAQGRSQDFYGGGAKMWTPTGDFKRMPLVLAPVHVIVAVREQ